MATGTIVEEVATNLEEAAEATRKLDTRAVGFFLGGVGVGVAIGFFFGYRFNREKLRAEAFAKSEEEVEKIRKVYQERSAGVFVAPEKPAVEDLVEEKGYSQAAEVHERPLPSPVPLVQEPKTRGGAPFSKRTEDGEKDKNDDWDYPTELAQRGPVDPYIIHQDEFSSNESNYNQVTYTYYTSDDVLADEHDTVLHDVDNLVGLENLTKFGHGADDFNVLFVRNPRLEVEYEVCRSPGSYEQEIMGLEHSDDYERIRRHDRGLDNDEAD